MRFELREEGGAALPALDLDNEVMIGSSSSAHIRLPHTIAHGNHVKIVGQRWTALADVAIDGQPRRANESGEVGSGITLGVGAYRIAVKPAPSGVAPSTPQRTESLARELVRAVLGAGEPPTISVEKGLDAGSERGLSPPESSLVIGRGDDADWVILDEDLSRVHCEIQRNWDGVWIRDLESKNGTRVDGTDIGSEPVELRDGCAIEIGNLTLRFADPAEPHLRAGISRPDRAAVSLDEPARAVHDRGGRAAPLWIALAVAAIAIAGLAWILLS